MLAGDLQKAEWFFKEACFRFPEDKIGLLWLTFLEVQTGNTVQANRHMRRLLDSVKLSDLLAWMPEGESIGLLRDSVLLPERKPEMLALLGACIGSRLGGHQDFPLNNSSLRPKTKRLETRRGQDVVGVGTRPSVCNRGCFKTSPVQHLYHRRAWVGPCRAHRFRLPCRFPFLGLHGHQPPQLLRDL
jgi:hypothetical protein